MLDKEVAKRKREARGGACTRRHSHVHPDLSSLLPDLDPLVAHARRELRRLCVGRRARDLRAHARALGHDAAEHEEQRHRGLADIELAVGRSVEHEVSSSHLRDPHRCCRADQLVLRDVRDGAQRQDESKCNWWVFDACLGGDELGGDNDASFHCTPRSEVHGLQDANILSLSFPQRREMDFAIFWHLQ
eukprot:2434933-Rhodomonas_salina.1